MAMGTAAMVPLRRRLLWLALAALVPLAVSAGIGLGALMFRQHDEAQRAGIELSAARSR
jgi:predicted membrane-bound mannosyltransferase